MNRCLLPKRAMAGLGVAALLVLAWLTLLLAPRTTAVPGRNADLDPDPIPDQGIEPADPTSPLALPATNALASHPERSLRQRLARRTSQNPASAGGRDPFVYGSHSDPSFAHQGGSATTPDLVVQGISVGHGKALTVVNRTLLGIGDRLGDWQVVRIEPDAVWFDGPAGRLTLRLPRGSDPGVSQNLASPSFAADADFDDARSAPRPPPAPSHP